jgi:hypothetical protein
MLICRNDALNVDSLRLKHTKLSSDIYCAARIKTGWRLIYSIYNFGSYVTENTVCDNYKKQSLHAVEFSNHCQLYAIHIEHVNTLCGQNAGL